MNAPRTNPGARRLTAQYWSHNVALTPALQDRLAVAAQARQQPASVVIRDLLDAHLPQLPEGVAP